jgi:hypothetical protein
LCRSRSFARFAAYRDKKVVGVFVRFSCAASASNSEPTSPLADRTPRLQV